MGEAYVKYSRQATVSLSTSTAKCLPLFPLLCATPPKTEGRAHTPHSGPNTPPNGLPNLAPLSRSAQLPYPPPTPCSLGALNHRHLFLGALDAAGPGSRCRQTQSGAGSLPGSQTAAFWLSSGGAESTVLSIPLLTRARSYHGDPTRALLQP